MKQRTSRLCEFLIFKALLNIPVQEMINNRNRSVVRDMKWSLHLSFTHRDLQFLPLDSLHVVLKSQPLRGDSQTVIPLIPRVFVVDFTRC